ncbi:hypothetical protein [Roseibium sp. SCP14]
MLEFQERIVTFHGPTLVQAPPGLTEALLRVTHFQVRNLKAMALSNH